MIADALEAEILAYAARTRRENPLYRQAANGTLPAACVTHYLANVLDVLRHTPRFLRHAHERAVALGDMRLAAFFLDKIDEERGHDKWAERDVKRMTVRTPQASRDVLPAIEELKAFTLAIIDEDPALILTYMLFNESLVVILGDEWLAALEKHCGIPRTSMTSVGNHVVLDRDHTEEALASIDLLVGDPRKVVRMVAVLRQAMAIFDRFFMQIVEESDGRGSIRQAVHAPAA